MVVIFVVVNALILSFIVEHCHANSIEQNAAEDKIVEAAVVNQVYHTPSEPALVRHLTTERSIGQFDHVDPATLYVFAPQQPEIIFVFGRKLTRRVPLVLIFAALIRIES